MARRKSGDDTLLFLLLGGGALAVAYYFLAKKPEDDQPPPPPPPGSTCADQGGECSPDPTCQTGQVRRSTADCSNCCVSDPACSATPRFSWTNPGQQVSSVRWNLNGEDVCEISVEWLNDDSLGNASTLVCRINGGTNLPGDTGCSAQGETRKKTWRLPFTPVFFVDFIAVTGGCLNLGGSHNIGKLSASLKAKPLPPPPSKTCASQGGQCTSADICNIKGGHGVSSTDCARVCCAPGSPTPQPMAPPTNETRRGVRTW